MSGKGMKKGTKMNKTQRGVERVFTNPKDLEDEERNSRNFNRGMPPSDSESEEEDTKLSNPAAAFIDIANPNRKTGKNTMKLKDLSINDDDEEEKPQLNRREREALEKERKQAHYFKLQMEGKTDQARADLARLALIRKQREEAKAKKEEAEQAASSKKAESLAAGKARIQSKK
ncbi:hypothetical protein HDV02_000725 [Globomyces sp. JEL0801]|nr:hypothetical protein HDV02_000725 [Globomyces sp. JEL0801]